MTDRERHVVDYYSRHPISSEHVLAKLRESRGHLDDLAPRNCIRTIKTIMGA